MITIIMNIIIMIVIRESVRREIILVMVMVELKMEEEEEEEVVHIRTCHLRETA